MKKLTITLLASLSLVAASFAGQEVYSGKDSKKTIVPQTCFNDHELQLDVFGVYQDGNANTHAGPIRDHGWGGGIGINYFFSRYIGVGAEGIMIPETKNDMEAVLARLEKSRSNKHSKIIIVAEGDEAGGAFKVGEKVKEVFPQLDVRITVLGHIQRGGSPSCMERVNASRMGYAAVQALIEGQRQVMIGIVDKKIVYTPFAEATKQQQDPDPELLKMVEVLAR